MHSRYPKAAGKKKTNSPEALCCRRFLVHGRVQGVFFRASTREFATELGLRGYARNLPDGTVEVLACGRIDAIDKLGAWLQKGPRTASVSKVEEMNELYRDTAGFSIA